MTVSYGTEEGRLSVGIDVSMSPSVVTKDTASVVLTWKVYAKATYAFNDGQTMTLSNALTASTSYTMVSPNGTPTVKLVGTYTQTVSTSYSGTVTKTLTAAASGLFNGGTPIHSRAVAIPKRPPQVPAAPLTTTVARTSDTALVVSLTAPATWDDVDRAWANVVIQRSTDGGPYISVATLAASARSWVDTSAKSNHQYSYRSQARNASGYSGVTYSGAVQTTPAAPSLARASKVGANILVTWTDNAPYGAVFDVWDNGVFLATTAADAVAYTHTAPDPGVTHVYTVRAKTTTAPTLLSTPATTNTVQLQAAPNAPTGLAPNGASVDAAGDTALSWSHNPVDTTTQTQFELQHRLVGGPTWTTTGVVTSATQSWALPEGTYPSGSAVEWQVTTRGAHASFSPWSAVAAFTLISKPVVSITGPVGPVYDTSVLDVDWTYFQSEGRAQASWTLTVTNTDTGTLLRTIDGTGVGTSWSSVTPLLENGVNYRLELVAREAGALASEPDFVDILVTFEPPTPPQITAEWMEEAGYNEVAMKATGIGNEQRRNLVTNPNFAVNIDDWASGFGATPLVWDGAVFETGSGSLRATCPSDNTMEAMTTAPTVAGQTYTALARVKASKAMTIRFGEYFGTAPAKAIGTDWTWVSQTFVCSGAGRQIGFMGESFAVDKPLTGDDLWVDRGMVVEGDIIGEYFDGDTLMTDTEIYQWDGPAHDSPSVAYERVDSSLDYSSPETVRMMLERSIEGADWELLGEFEGKGTTYFDWTAPVVGHIVYRATSITALPSSASSEVTLNIAGTGTGACSIYLSGGPGYARVARLLLVKSRDVETGRRRTLNEYAGRTNPVETSGGLVPRSTNVDAQIMPEAITKFGGHATRADLEGLFALAGPHLYRDASGLIDYVYLSPLRVSYDFLGAVGFTATRADAGNAATAEALSAFNGPMLIEARPGEYRIYGGTTAGVGPGEWTWSL